MLRSTESTTAYLFEDREDSIFLFSEIIQALGWSIGGIATSMDESRALTQHILVSDRQSIAFIDGNLDGWTSCNDGKEIAEMLKFHAPQTVRIGICAGYSSVSNTNGVEGVDFNINKADLNFLLDANSDLRQRISSLWKK